MSQVADLPPIDFYSPKNTHSTGWADLYGSFKNLAGYLRVSESDLSSKDFYWPHGVIPPWVELPRLLLFNNEFDRDKLILTFTEEQRRIIQTAGYRNVYAVGSPILYLEDRFRSVKRVKGSALVMPQHSLSNIPRGSKRQHDNFLGEVARKVKSFDVVEACLGPACIESGFFINELEDMNIPAFVGARFNDRNALLRIRNVMSAFDTLITNGWGSHVAYALHFGMKIICVGEAFQVEKALLRRDRTYSSISEGELANQIKCINSGAIEFMEQFRSKSTSSSRSRSLGDFMVGASQRKDASKLGSIIFGEDYITLQDHWDV